MVFMRRSQPITVYTPALMVQVFFFIATKSNLYPHGKKIILSASCATVISKGCLGKLTTVLLLTKINLRKLFWKRLFSITFLATMSLIGLKVSCLTHYSVISPQYWGKGRLLHQDSMWDKPSTTPEIRKYLNKEQTTEQWRQETRSSAWELCWGDEQA